MSLKSLDALPWDFRQVICNNEGNFNIASELQNNYKALAFPESLRCKPMQFMILGSHKVIYTKEAAGILIISELMVFSF